MPDPFLPKPFRCQIAESDGAVRLRPEGELDISTVPQLEAQLEAALERGVRRLVVDLTGLDFMDSTGITLFTRWSQGAHRDGYEFALVPGDLRIQRLFELTGLRDHFMFEGGK